jgi:hypothetical protein
VANIHLAASTRIYQEKRWPAVKWEQQAGPGGQTFPGRNYYSLAEKDGQ